MRVIAGSARRIQLKTVDGMETRPTTDRIKETLFNILQMDIQGSVFLDLFAGSGAIGIEALSRGAKEAVFVENSKKACECIRINLEKTRLKDEALVMETDVIAALHRLNGKDRLFDIIFMDPPYELGIEPQVLSALADADYVDDYTIIVIEAKLDKDFDFVGNYGFYVTREKTYKTNKHVFLKKKKEGMM
ncbi:MAG: 16S rRNA (guanine(966)-N(2))-methyltransferase RsmD [Lachnospiraceae bacterium]|nr:16S rRNA (guanine(966)-N(2))-methyltransferase RsmD [Lachnospiraceae bacterium]